MSCCSWVIDVSRVVISNLCPKPEEKMVQLLEQYCFADNVKFRIPNELSQVTAVMGFPLLVKGKNTEHNLCLQRAVACSWFTTMPFKQTRVVRHRTSYKVRKMGFNPSGYLLFTGSFWTAECKRAWAWVSQLLLAALGSCPLRGQPEEAQENSISDGLWGLKSNKNSLK